MMTEKRLIATVFALVALVAWGTATPNLAVAQDQLQLRDRLLMQTPGTCLPAPLKDQLQTQTKDRLQTPTTAAVTTTQPQQTTSPVVLQTRQQLQTQTQVVTPSGDMLQQRSSDQIRLNTRTGGGPR